MIKLFILLLGICISFIGSSQFQLGSEQRTTGSPIQVLTKYLADIDTSRTIFVYRRADEENLDELIEAINSVWTLTEMEFMSYDDFLDYETVDGESYFTISVDNTVISGSGGSVSYLSNFGLSFWRQVDGYARFFSFTQLFAEFDANLSVMKSGVEGSGILEKLYTEYEIRNWNLGFLKAALKDVNENIENGGSRSPFKSMETAEIRNLKTETLYISDDVLIELKKMSRTEKKDVDPEKLFKDFPFEYKIVTNSEINDLVVNNESQYCLIYVRNSMGKFLVIYNSGSGNIVYTYYATGFTVEKKEIQQLVKKINSY
jgi:hypothetical protein